MKREAGICQNADCTIKPNTWRSFKHQGEKMKEERGREQCREIRFFFNQKLMPPSCSLGTIITPDTFFCVKQEIQ